MYSKGKHKYLIILIYIFIWVKILSHGGGSSAQAVSYENDLTSDTHIPKRPAMKGTNGDLYDIFMERLNQVKQELIYHELPNNNQEGKLSSRKITPRQAKTTNLSQKRPNRSLSHIPKINRCRNDNISHRNLSQSLYPSVLTKALEISLNPNKTGINNKGNILENIADKMNTSVMDIASILTKPMDLNVTTLEESKNLKGIIKNYIFGNENSGNFQQNPSILRNIPDDNRDRTTTEIRNVLERVLDKLEQLKGSENRNEGENHVNGTPCNILGTWFSTTLGLCFEIHWANNSFPWSYNNKSSNKLSIKIQECIPPKRHNVMDLEWKIEGTTYTNIGGPFYVYTQHEKEHLAGTFLGFCWICDDSDIVYGSWTFLKPIKDCVAASMAFEVKRDVWRRDRMKMKCKKRLKALHYGENLEKIKETGN
ncbi:uncharacterized protein LOC109612074 [Musca domestica]|uniref:Uncharacterized protein LOC109612074 n=1 Tax=Musca domestica TaxID=7370 RepID=A0A9J7DDV4_MUSDO|nr:uncharacterized protein LOC109612074 [Musca domestica]